MRSFLERISSRKFLTALAVQVAAVVALFLPQHESEAAAAATRIAALAALLLAALGYGKIEGQADIAGAPAADAPESNELH
jgi:hypothetical protein